MMPSARRRATSGTLTDEEFAAEKTHVLNGS
jgi:hypothetical protein